MRSNTLTRVSNNPVHSPGRGPQSHHYFANRPMWRNQECVVISD